MAIWSGRKKALTILLFTLPTLIGVLVFNVYPIILNTYISFTNRNKSHPNPDCSAALNSVLIPTCWPTFRENAPVGLGTPFSVIEPATRNYTDLLGDLFTPTALWSFGRLLLMIAPLGAVLALNRQWDKKPDSRPIPSWVVWLLGLAGVAIIFVLLQATEAWSTLMATGDFVVVVLRTLLFVIIRVPFTFVIGLFLALILNSKWIKARAFFRVVLFLPWAASSMAILMALVWQFFFRDQGTINQVLGFLGIAGNRWLQDPVATFAAIVIADVWFSYPFVMVVVLGALQSISSEVYEAAEMDGANWWQQLMSITLPLIRPAILPAMVLTSITAFQMFGSAFAINGGGPTRGAGVPGATEFVMIYAYKQVFQNGNYGRATAFAVIIFIMLFTATLLSLRMTKITKGAYE
jgi:arabinogalactan oligomer/maltooligosaccharide transport system permease protein